MKAVVCTVNVEVGQCVDKMDVEQGFQKQPGTNQLGRLTSP